MLEMLAHRLLTANWKTKLFAENSPERGCQLMTCSHFRNLIFQGCPKGHRPTVQLLCPQQNPVRDYCFCLVLNLGP